MLTTWKSIIFSGSIADNLKKTLFSQQVLLTTCKKHRLLSEYCWRPEINIIFSASIADNLKKHHLFREYCWQTEKKHHLLSEYSWQTEKKHHLLSEYSWQTEKKHHLLSEYCEIIPQFAEFAAQWNVNPSKFKSKPSNLLGSKSQYYASLIPMQYKLCRRIISFFRVARKWHSSYAEKSWDGVSLHTYL